jgi:hypothetical protein
MKFNAKIDVNSFEVLNSEFTKAKCYILYTGENRNGSSISKETVEAALPSIFNCPVIGEFLKKDDGTKDFGSHGGRIIIDSTGIRYEQTTMPYGVVPESANPRWEMVDDKEYLVCEIILWSGRYDDLDVFLADGQRPQSMEISPLEFEEKNGLFEIKSFEFSALTILGSDVEPCFEDAKIETYASDKFNLIFEEMKNALKDLFKKDEDDEPMMDEEDMMPEEEDEKEKMSKNFAMTMKDKLRLLQDSIEDERVADADDNTISYKSYWVMDFDDNYVYVSMYAWERDGSSEDRYYRATFSIDEENQTAIINKESFEEIIQKWVTLEESQAIDDERQQFENLKTDFEALESEVIDLRKFKQDAESEERKAEISALLDEFSVDLVNCEDFINFRNEAVEKKLSNEEISEKCYAILGRVKFERKPKKDKEKPLATFVNIDTATDSKASERYGSAIRYFKPKNN